MDKKKRPSADELLADKFISTACDKKQMKKKLESILLVDSMTHHGLI
jgi:hypothetical protein